MRLFTCIPLPFGVIKEIDRISRELQGLHLFEGSWVLPENLHITLVFFGSVTEEDYDDIAEELARVIHPAVNIELNGIEVNARSHPHVIWLSVEAPGVIALAQNIVGRFPDYKQEREFNGHITIARIKSVTRKAELFKALDATHIHPVSWQATSFQLVVSDTLPEGPLYTVQATYPLE